MKAIAKRHPEPGLWMTDEKMPQIGSADILIKIRKTAICGSDMHIFNWDALAQAHVPVPMVVGHEYAGEVVEVGKDVVGFNVGDRVSGEGHITCGRCKNCRTGTQQMHGLLDAIARSLGTHKDLKLLEELCEVVQATSLCGLGQTAPNPVLSTLRYFRDEYERKLSGSA